MNNSEIIEVVKDYVKTKMQDDCTGHDYYHIMRVVNNALLINKEEKKDEFIIVMIAILHDLYDHKFTNVNVRDALINDLRNLKVYEYIQKEDLENILHSIENLGYSSNIKEKKNLSDEGKIVQDADRLDGMGAIGIARTFAYGGYKHKPMHIPEIQNYKLEEKEYKKNGSKTSTMHFYDKLLKLNDLLNTKEAKRIEKKRKKFLEEFLREFLEEWDGKR